MHAVALALLTGLLIVVPPEHQDPPLHSYEPPHLLHSAQQAAKQAAQKIICDKPPCPPTTLDNIKASLHHGYQKTANTLEGAKGFVTDRIEAAKETVEGAYSHVKGGVHERADKSKNGVQEKVEKVKHGVHETADKAASYLPGSHADEPDPVSYIMPGVGQTMGTLKRKLDDGRQEASTFFEESPALDSLKTKVEQASTYIPSADTAASHIQDKVHDMQRSTADVTNGMKNTIGNPASHIQDKVRDMQRSTADVTNGVKNTIGNTIGDVYDRAGECRSKLGGFLHGLKVTLARSVGKNVDSSDVLDKRVHDLCSSMLEDDEGADEGVHVGTKSDSSPLHESYIYLMESALKAIDGAKEVFEKAVEGEGAEWKEKYVYLSETARGAVEGAKEVFDRAVVHESRGVHRDAAMSEKVPEHLMDRLKEAAVHTKYRVSAVVRSLVRTMYLASFSTAFGVTLWVTFFSGHLLSRALPRQQLAIVQSKLFPAYLRAVTGCMVVCAIGHMVLHPWPSANWWEYLQHWNFSFSLVISLCSTLLVEPKITKIMFEKLKIEKEEGRGQSGEAMDDQTMARLASVDGKFKGLHQVASIANLATIAGLSWHLWYLANRLVV